MRDEPNVGLRCQTARSSDTIKGVGLFLRLLSPVSSVFPPDSAALHLQQWLGIGHPLKRHPFSGLVHSAGELLHTP